MTSASPPFSPPLQLDAPDNGVENSDLPPPLEITSPQACVSSLSTTTTSATTGSSKSRQSLSGITGFGPLRLDVTTPSTTKSTPEAGSVEFEGFSNPMSVRAASEMSPSNRGGGGGSAADNMLSHGSAIHPFSIAHVAAAAASAAAAADLLAVSSAAFTDDAPTPSNRASTATPTHKLGHGASGNVVLMQRLADSRLVAIKRLKSGVDHRDMAKRESAFVRLSLAHFGMTSSMGAPYGLINVFGVFKKDGVTRIIMEYMDHGHAGSLGAIPTRPLAAFTKQLLEGLRVLHEELRVIHRDLKPTNILVNSEGHVKLADFGVAAMLEPGTDTAVDQVGTIMQMSPERLRGEPHDFSSDVWALGLTVAELALGYHPFAKGLSNAAELQSSEDRFWRAVELLAATSPSERCSAISRATIENGISDCDPIVRAFVLRCTKSRPSARPSIAELNDDPLLADLTLDAAVAITKEFLATERPHTRLMPEHSMIDVLPPTNVDLDD